MQSEISESVYSPNGYKNYPLVDLPSDYWLHMV